MTDIVNIAVTEQQENVVIGVTETTDNFVVNVSSARGDVGPQGPAGLGVIPGGTTNQVLTKHSDLDYETYWSDKTILRPGGSNLQIQYNDGDSFGGDVNFLFDKNAKSVVIGNGTLLPTNPLSVSQSVDSYVQINLQNENTVGIYGSSDYVATNSTGNNTKNYVDMGINNDTFSDPAYPYSGPNDSYLVNTGGSLVVGTIDHGLDTILMAGSEHKVHIDGSGLNVLSGNSLRVNGFNVLDVISSASSAAMESDLFSRGAKLIIRTDLL